MDLNFILSFNFKSQRLCRSETAKTGGRLIMKKQKSTIKTIVKNNKYILKFVSEASPYFILITVLISLTAFIDTFANTWFSKVVFDGMAEHTPYLQIVKVVLILLGFMLISALLRSYYEQNSSVVENEKIRTHIRTKVLEKTSELDFECFENPEFYDKYTKAIAEADSRASAVLESVSSLSYSVVTLATLFTIILALNPILFLFAAVGVTISFLINTYLGKLRYQYNNERVPSDRKANYIHRIFYEPQYAQNIKMDTMVTYFVQQYKSLGSNIILIIKKRANRITVMEFLSQMQYAVMQILMTLYLTYRVYQGVLSIGDYAALLNSTFALMFQLNHFVGLIPQFYEHSLFISNLKTVMDYKPTIEKQAGLLLEEAEQYSIEFQNVTFQYPNQTKPTLKNVSFAFHTGENIALVGHNGAGKSTIVKLIVRLYDVTDGCILINGRDIREYNVFSLRKHFSAVFQDYQSYAVSIADNLLGGVYSPTQKALVDDALEKSGLTQKINALPDGIQTQLSKEFDEKGVSLSGGEMQKLALARVFLRNSPFIILDEPSSALDPIAEHQLTENMLQAAKNKAVLTISHRLSTTRNSTKIYLLNQGSILEEGTHEELICKAGLYKKMFDVQAENYQVENANHL